MSPARGNLPYVDEHARTSVERFSLRPCASREAAPIARLLGAQLPAGFEVLDSAPAHGLTLAGRQRFARHMLTFELTDAAEVATYLRPTCALFPGARGQAYRAGHRHPCSSAATTHILRSVRRLSLGPA